MPWAGNIAPEEAPTGTLPSWWFNNRYTYTKKGNITAAASDSPIHQAYSSIKDGQLFPINTQYCVSTVWWWKKMNVCKIYFAQSQRNSRGATEDERRQRWDKQLSITSIYSIRNKARHLWRKKVNRQASHLSKNRLNADSTVYILTARKIQYKYRRLKTEAELKHDSANVSDTAFSVRNKTHTESRNDNIPQCITSNEFVRGWAQQAWLS